MAYPKRGYELFFFGGSPHMNAHPGRVILARLLREAVWAPVGVLLLYYALQASAYRSDAYWTFHFLGGAALGFFFFQAVRIAGGVFGTLRPISRHVLAFTCACTVAMFWELGEFAWDELMGTRLQRSLEETMVDLVLSALGAAVALLLMAGARRLRR